MPANTKPTAGYLELAHRWLLREGAYVRGLRAALGLSQQEVAERAGISGKAVISLIETGKLHVPPERISSLAQALDVHPPDFCRRLLSTQHPWIFVHLFPGDRRLAGELRHASKSQRISVNP